MNKLSVSELRQLYSDYIAQVSLVGYKRAVTIQEFYSLRKIS